MEQLIRTFRWLDYGVGFAALGYGIYAGSLLFVLTGILGLLIARLNMAERISTRLKTHFLRKRQPPAKVSHEAEPAAPWSSPVTSDYGRPRLTISTTVSFSSPHSLLRSPEHFNHAHRVLKHR